jgi:hypothetical protein
MASQSAIPTCDKAFSQQSVVFTKTRTNDHGVPVTSIYQSGYGSTQENGKGEKQWILKDGEFVETTLQEFNRTRLEQDRFTSNMRSFEGMVDRRLFMEWPQLASRVGLTFPASITPSLSTESELDRLRRENTALLNEREEWRRSRKDSSN